MVCIPVAAASQDMKRRGGGSRRRSGVKVWVGVRSVEPAGGRGGVGDSACSLN